MQIDYLIAGQGLAGTLLAHHLLQRKKKVLIVDEFDENSSSRVAAGLFNPITGKKFVKTWNANLLFPYLHNFYPQYERVLGEKFFYPADIYRPFSTIEEQNDWQGHSGKPSYQLFIKEIYRRHQFEGISDPCGGILIKGGGFLDLPLMLSRARQIFKEKGVLWEEKLDDKQLAIDDKAARYKQAEARKIIFCRGRHDAASTFFGWLPFRPVKGEILSLKSATKTDKIYNKGCFLTPEHHGVSKCGSTYDRHDSTTTPTEKARNTILANLRALINWEVDVVGQKAGIRPASADRRPLAGLHPEFKSLAIFNGLGTKGVTLAPYYADQFINFLEEGRNLDAEINIERYYSLYYNSFSQEK